MDDPAADAVTEALARIDAVHAEDPQAVEVDGERVPAELLYARRMTEWLQRLCPGAAVPLRLAARAQHLRRWALPRAEYPPGRAGYKRWRSELARRHASDAVRLAREAGIDERTAERVGDLVQKKRLRTDPDVQILEDVACLVFLEHHLADFARAHDDDKVVDILRKTWGKMSERGRGAAQRLPLGGREAALLRRALEE